MSSNDSNCPFCPGEASLPGVLSSNKGNRTCEFPQHPPAMADHPHARFVSAIRAAEFDTVKSLLDLYGLPHMVNRLPRCSFLCESLLNKTEDIAKLLIQHGAEVNVSTDLFETPLHLAAENGYTAVVSMLLEKGALVNAKDYCDETSLHYAVRGGKLEIIESLLNRMADLEVKTKGECITPLHLAVNLLGKTQSSKDEFDYTLAQRCQLCRYVPMNTTDATNPDTSREKIVQLLLDRGADVDALDNVDNTVLMKAVEQWNLRIIEHILLVRPEARLNEHCLRISEHPRMLHDAVRKGCTRIVVDLLMQGAPIEMRHESANGGTLLHSAAASGRMTIAELLVERGADVNAKDKNGKTPILYSVENMDPAMTRFFLNNGANDQGRPRLLHTAAEQFCSHIVEMILEHFPSIDVNAVENVASTKLSLHSSLRFDDRYPHSLNDEECEWSVTALHVAAAGGVVRVVEVLLDHNANIDSFAKSIGTPLHCSVLQTNGTIVDLLLVKGAEVDADRGDGSTPLHLAVRAGNAMAFELLIKYGADLHKKNNAGLNLVHIATPDGHLKMFEADLLDVFKAGHPRTNVVHSTALHIAVTVGDIADVEILLRHGADASVGNFSGDTPLHFAACGDFFERDVAEALLSSLYDVDLRNNDGQTAFHYVHHLEAVRLLLFHGCDVNIEDNFGQTPLISFRARYPREDDSFDECEIAIQEHIVKMMALGLEVNNKNMPFIDVSSLHKDLYDKCNQEVQTLKITKIGESRISFYKFLTTGKKKSAFYSRNPNIAKVLERGDYKNTFKLYGDMIESRFQKTKMINDLVLSGARYLKVWIGYSLSDYDLTEIVRYLDRRDLQNVILAGCRDEKSKK